MGREESSLRSAEVNKEYLADEWSRGTCNGKPMWPCPVAEKSTGNEKHIIRPVRSNKHAVLPSSAPNCKTVDCADRVTANNIL